ncbi:MAG: CD1247 N-terminal domain-containing protein [Oscillospiraceae bacterium]
MDIAEKVAYLKGLAEGLKLDEETKEGKLLAAVIDLLGDISDELEELEDEVCELEEGIDAVSDDLSDVEEFLYEEDDEDEDDEDECYATTCPNCEEEIFFDDSVLEDGEVICPNCGERLEFDLSDLANAAGVEDEEEDD